MSINLEQYLFVLKPGIKLPSKLNGCGLKIHISGSKPVSSGPRILGIEKYLPCSPRRNCKCLKNYARFKSFSKLIN